MTSKSLSVVLLLFGLLSVGNAIGQEQISFNRQIRPILADICFNCHGPDAATNEGGVRLDSLDAAIKEGDSGNAAIVPGDPKGSELIARVLSADDPMPPADFAKQLTAEQKELLSRWIKQGAKFEGHWAFQPVVRPKVPTVTDANWPTNAIDHFILEKLEQNDLTPSAQAAKATLIRRVALDLTGLPPTLAELESYLEDTTDDAYEKMIDRYLESPKYGERMAVPWLDYARYADSNGFQSDGSRDIWAWREWVINAYNRNLPFDEFTVEQLAGDMLPNPTRAQLVATGFNRNHRLNGEGGRIVDEWFVETVIDRVETTAMTWLGLTYNCCRCHDHKYDPISQKEFFQMFAFFNSNEESGVLAPAGKNGENTPPLLPLTTPEDLAKIALFESEIAAAKTAFEQLKGKENELVAQWTENIKKELAGVPRNIWSPVELESVTADEGVKFEKQSDGSYLASGPNPANPTYTIRMPLNAGLLSGIMVEAIPDDKNAHKFLGRAGQNGNFVLTDIRFSIDVEGQDKPTRVRFSKAESDFSQPNWPAANVLVSDTKVTEKSGETKGWATLGFDATAGNPNRIMFVAKSTVEIPENATGTLRLFHRSPYPQHSIGRFRINVTNVASENVSLETQTVPKEIRNSIAIHPKHRNSKQKKVLLEHFKNDEKGQFNEAAKKLGSAKAKLKDFKDRLLTTMVMKEGDARDAFILERGEYDKPKEKVGRELPAFLPSMPEGQSMDDWDLPIGLSIGPTR